MIVCKNCGANMRYDAAGRCLSCDYCGSTLEIVNNTKIDITSEEQLMDATVYTCPQCGGEIYTTEDTAATFCSYCGSSVLLESRVASIAKPDYIIPFKITKEQAAEKYLQRLRHAMFAPSSLKSAQIEKLRGIYMPYWEYYYDSQTSVNFSADGSSVRKGDYVYTDVYDVSFLANIKSDGLEFDASSKLPDDLSQSFAPYYFKESKMFNPAYMSGFYADVGDVPSYTYTGQANKLVADTAADEITSYCSFGEARVNSDTISGHIYPGDPYVGLAMYPVWFASARTEDGKHINYATVNGQTGKVAADVPIDKKKLIIWSLIFAVPVFLLVYFLLSPTPRTTLILVALLAVVGYIVGKRTLNVMNPEDLGVKNSLSREKNNQTSEDAEYETKVKRNMTIRLVITIAITVLIAFINPVQDYIHYAAAMAGSVLCGWNYWRIFDIYNRKISRPLPQLDKR